jgi:chromosome segregation ATPase
MNPLDSIKKWISEHGSAAILRDLVALLKEQIEISEREKAVLKSERDTFKASVERLQTQLEEAHVEIENLGKSPKKNKVGVHWLGKEHL